MKILVVDDEKLIVKGIKFNLEQEGYQVEVAYDGEEAVRLAHDESIDLILLDLMLPKIDGFTVCRTIRGFSNVPIIMLTAKSEDIDKILGLEYGADDYITKPFNIREVTSRIKAILRRTKPVGQQSQNKDILISGNITLDYNFRRVTIKDKVIDLTGKEFDLLELFIKNPGKVYTRENLLDIAWGFDYPGDVRTAYEWARENNIVCWMVSATQTLMSHADAHATQAMEDIHTKLPPLGDLAPMLDHPVYKVVLFTTRDKLEELLPQVPHSHTTLWHDYGQDIISRQGGKKLCMLECLRQIGIDPSEVIAFGDSENDIEMLRAAGIGVAMDNGTPECKAAADYITSDCDEEGILRALEHFGLI